MPIGINMQFFVDLKFLGRSHTKIRKLHLLTKRPNFLARKKLATFPRTRVFGGHETEKIVSQYAVPSIILIPTRRVVRIISTEAFARTCFGQQC